MKDLLHFADAVVIVVNAVAAVICPVSWLQQRQATDAFFSSASVS